MKTASVRHKILAAAMAFSATACGYYNEVLQPPGGAQTPFKQEQTLGFEVVKTVLGRNRCFECHAGMQTYGNAKPAALEIASRTLSGSMPRGGPRVSAGDQAILQAWADAGAPETSTIPLPGSEAPAPLEPPVPDEPPAPVQGLDFAKVNAAIFTPHCIGCHAAFATYARVASRLPEIQRAIDTNAMPKGGPALNADLKIMLAEWIAAGAPETAR